MNRNGNVPALSELPPATVLVVDDSRAIVEAVAVQLAGCGLTVRTAASGEDCLRAVHEAPPDLILLDIIMPGIDGFETCRRLKQSEATRDIPVLFMTSLGETTDILRGFEAGGVDYLHKPLELSELVARLRAHLLLRQRNLELAEAMARLLRSEKLLISGKLAAAGQISAGVAHEIANPSHFAHLSAQQMVSELADVHQFLQQLAGDDADPTVLAAIEGRFRHLQSLLDTILEGTQRVHGMAQDLLVFARRDDEAVRSAQLGRVLAATVSLARAQYRHDIDIGLEIVDDPFLPCRPARLGQVFMNLLINACQAITRQRLVAPPDYAGAVQIRCRIRGDRLEVDVKDNGCGMPADVKARLFEPFFTTKASGEGTGLGMTLAHAIIRDHAGTLQIASTPGGGSQITLSLPLGSALAPD